MEDSFVKMKLLTTQYCTPVFTSKSLTSVGTRYTSIESEALGILLGLKEVHPYCFVHKVSMIPDHKP